MQRNAPFVQPTVWCSAQIQGRMPAMIPTAKRLTLAIFLLLTSAALLKSSPAPALPGGPEYTGDDQLKLPENYRQWVYLTTGFDMSYSAGSMNMDHHMFDNVFVNPESYKAFTETGTWPDKTMLVLEVRKAEGRGSINQKGNFQSTNVMGLEVHVKDEARFPGKWAFFGFDDNKTAKMTPKEAACYTCHQDHGAVDTTFVQFYPTLLPIAQSKATLSAGYQKDEAAKK
ncbi:MAG TPA: cytochrome P460 family protein [Candidatus Eisenbacteria bacterium]|nr:cytochrome P460 family protein [Candidatus Eisenbacteria bacterium]